MPRRPRNRDTSTGKSTAIRFHKSSGTRHTVGTPRRACGRFLAPIATSAASPTRRTEASYYSAHRGSSVASLVG